MASESAYQKLGVSATKEDVHKAVENVDKGLFPGAFCRISEDVLAGDNAYCCAQHADGAGTKALAAYIVYKETQNPAVFQGIAQDSLVMNTDDLVCIGATQCFLVANTIGRNRFFVPGAVIAEIVNGYEACLAMLRQHGVRALSTGGETADLGDNVRTLVVDSTVATRLRRDDVIDNDNIQPGDVILGFSSTGQASYESKPNSGIGSNGLTLARHRLLKHDYAETYAETFSPEVPKEHVYQGRFGVSDSPDGLNMTVGEALTSPTRTYVPVLKKVFERFGKQVHGAIHVTGGGQAKCKNFGKGIRYIKDNLFPIPPLFQRIAETGISIKEMYQTFNMGHRLEILVPEEVAQPIIEISQQFGIACQVVGRCERAQTNQVIVDAQGETYKY